MSDTNWRKRFSIVNNRLYLYPKPEPMPHSRLFWLAMGLVTVAVVLFSGYFILYLLAQHNAFLTNAEDLGIMDQSIWNTLHGNILHMSICNIVSDTNCVTPAGYTRFAIHFEPILFLVSGIYFFWQSPMTLIVLQTLVVAAGAYPAFWLARLRLRSELAGVAIALLYLLYPALQQAITYDFHAVTFTAALLMFTLYFMYTRETVWMFVFAILAMACKEEMPLVLMMFGFWSILFQRRWKSGLALMGLAGVWFVVGFLYIIPHFSPTGAHLLISRYDGIKALLKKYGVVQVVLHPKLFLQPYVLDPDHAAYLHILLAPGGYIPLPGKLPSVYLLLFAPWILVLALPSLFTNLLSSAGNMYSGLFQYNAEIVPVLIFATIEAIVLLIWIVQFVWSRVHGKERAASDEVVVDLPRRRWENARMVQSGLLVALLSFSLFSAMRLDFSFHGQLPYAYGYQWPQETAHTELAQKFIEMIPAGASVSAQTKLVPHVSERKTIYMFPYGVDHAESEYVFLDITGDVYPYYGTTNYIREVKTVLRSGKYGVVAAQDGYLLLKRGLPAPVLSVYTPIVPNQFFDPVYNDKLAFTLPDSLCSYVDDDAEDIANPFQADFTSDSDDGSISLLGSSVGAPATFSRDSGYMSVTTYWRVNSPVKEAKQVLLFMQGSDGKEHYVSTDFPDVYWCQTNTWKPGTVIKLTSRVFGIQQSKIPNGIAHLSVALIPLLQPSDKMMDVQARLSVRVVHANKEAAKETNAVGLKALTIIN